MLFRSDIVIDPCAGSGITLLASENLGRKSYGFEIKKEFVKAFDEKLNFTNINTQNNKIGQMVLEI